MFWKSLIVTALLAIVAAPAFADKYIGTMWRGSQELRVFEAPNGDKYSVDRGDRIIHYGRGRSFDDIVRGEGATIKNRVKSEPKEPKTKEPKEPKTREPPAPREPRENPRRDDPR